MSLGVVIGKFMPLHHGHSLLINTALDKCTDVRVIICAKPDHKIDGKIREKWINILHPEAKTIITDAYYPDNDSLLWAAHTIRWLGGYWPDYVFSSEDYENYAWLMGAEHICLDKDRKRVPISATKIKSNPEIYEKYMYPIVFDWMIANWREEWYKEDAIKVAT